MSLPVWGPLHDVIPACLCGAPPPTLLQALRAVSGSSRALVLGPECSPAPLPAWLTAVQAPGLTPCFVMARSAGASPSPAFVLKTTCSVRLGVWESHSGVTVSVSFTTLFPGVTVGLATP